MEDPIILRRTGLNLFFPVAGTSAVAILEGTIVVLFIKGGGIAELVAALGIFLPFSVSFAAYAWMAWKSRVSLHTDRIVKFNGFWSRTIMRSEIQGVRLSTNRSLLRIVSKDGRGMLLLLKLLKDNEAAAAWFDGLDDLDAQDFQASLDRISQDKRFGSTPERRIARILWLRWLIGPLFWLTIIVFLWALVWPHPFLWVWGTLASIPVIAVVLDVLTHGGVRYDYRFGPRDARPTLAFQFFFPGLLLPAMVLRDWNILDLKELLATAGVLGTVAALALAVRSESLRRHVRPAVLCAAMLSGYALGLLSGIDVLFDSARQSRFPVHVLGVRPSDHFDYVEVAPWGPRKTANEVRIPGHLIHKLKRGDLVCIILGPGRLDFRWYGLGNC